MATIRLTRREVEDELLPELCLKCGSTTTTHKSKTFSWHPPWIGVLILACLLPYAIVAAIMTKRMTVVAPLCDQHRSHWLWRTLFLFLGLVFFVILAFVGILLLSLNNQPGAQQSDLAGLVCGASALSGLIWLIAAAIIQSIAIKPSEITDRSITLTNVSPKFKDALDDDRAREREEEDERPPRRRARPQDDDYDDDED